MELAQPRPVGLALGGAVLAGAEPVGDVVLGGAGASEACCVLLIGISVAMHAYAHSCCAHAVCDMGRIQVDAYRI